eukprot:TRINITY_DN6928_c0_g1_i1.p1 TRINITY_DN6928_c0_g1~~TRINITY_DN6928_c0_g1_i1.p1  ORF type:complete len:1250 (+),score=258.47 TRINITY_DN6928_c0_g1_i1:99-3752(+)
MAAVGGTLCEGLGADNGAGDPFRGPRAAAAKWRGRALKAREQHRPSARVGTPPPAPAPNAIAAPAAAKLESVAELERHLENFGKETSRVYASAARRRSTAPRQAGNEDDATFAEMTEMYQRSEQEIRELKALLRKMREDMMMLQRREQMRGMQAKASKQKQSAQAGAIGKQLEEAQAEVTALRQQLFGARDDVLRELKIAQLKQIRELSDPNWLRKCRQQVGELPDASTACTRCYQAYFQGDRDDEEALKRELKRREHLAEMVCLLSVDAANVRALLPEHLRNQSPPPASRARAMMGAANAPPPCLPKPVADGGAVDGADLPSDMSRQTTSMMSVQGRYAQVAAEKAHILRKQLRELQSWMLDLCGEMVAGFEAVPEQVTDWIEGRGGIFFGDGQATAQVTSSFLDAYDAGLRSSPAAREVHESTAEEPQRRGGAHALRWRLAHVGRVVSTMAHRIDLAGTLVQDALGQAVALGAAAVKVLKRMKEALTAKPESYVQLTRIPKKRGERQQGGRPTSGVQDPTAILTTTVIFVETDATPLQLSQEVQQITGLRDAEVLPEIWEPGKPRGLRVKITAPGSQVQRALLLLKRNCGPRATMRNVENISSSRATPPGSPDEAASESAESSSDGSDAREQPQPTPKGGAQRSPPHAPAPSPKGRGAGAALTSPSAAPRQQQSPVRKRAAGSPMAQASSASSPSRTVSPRAAPSAAPAQPGPTSPRQSAAQRQPGATLPHSAAGAIPPPPGTAAPPASTVVPSALHSPSHPGPAAAGAQPAPSDGAAEEQRGVSSQGSPQHPAVPTPGAQPPPADAADPALLQRPALQPSDSHHTLGERQISQQATPSFAGVCKCCGSPLRGGPQREGTGASSVTPMSAPRETPRLPPHPGLPRMRSVRERIADMQQFAQEAQQLRVSPLPASVAHRPTFVNPEPGLDPNWDWRASWDAALSAWREQHVESPREPPMAPEARRELRLIELRSAKDGLAQRPWLNRAASKAAIEALTGELHHAVENQVRHLGAPRARALALLEMLGRPAPLLHPTREFTERAAQTDGGVFESADGLVHGRSLLAQELRRQMDYLEQQQQWYCWELREYVRKEQDRVLPPPEPLPTPQPPLLAQRDTERRAAPAEPKGELPELRLPTAALRPILPPRPPPAEILRRDPTDPRRPYVDPAAPPPSEAGRRPRRRRHSRGASPNRMAQTQPIPKLDRLPAVAARALVG